MIEKIVYENKKITCITVRWEADFSELLGVLRKFIDDNNTEHLLLDFRLFSFDTIMRSNIRDLYEYATSRANVNSRVNGKTALVCSNGLQIEIGKIFKTYSDMINSPIKISAFRSMEKALSWLEEG
jgi:hypothetical protein